MNGLFSGPDGRLSSKRIAGLVCLYGAFWAASGRLDVDIFNGFLTAAVFFLAGGTAVEQIGKIGKIGG